MGKGWCKRRAGGSVGGHEVLNASECFEAAISTGLVTEYTNRTWNVHGNVSADAFVPFAIVQYDADSNLPAGCSIVAQQNQTLLHDKLHGNELGTAYVPVWNEPMPLSGSDRFFDQIPNRTGFPDVAPVCRTGARVWLHAGVQEVF